MPTRPPSGTANKSRGEKVAQKYRIVVPRSDFRLDSVRINATLAPAISQRAICAWIVRNYEATSEVRRTSQESRTQILTPWKIRIN